MAKKHKRLTIEELRKFKDFEYFKAEEKVTTLEKLSILFYDLHMKKRKDEEMGAKYLNEDRPVTE